MPDQHTPLKSGRTLPPCSHRPSRYAGPTREEIIALRGEYMNPGLFTYYREPLCIVEGHMQYLYDDAGRRYLDAVAGIAVISVGHCHPAVVRRAVERLDDDKRFVVLLCYHAGLTHEQAAEILELPLGTLKSRLHAALTELRGVLAAEAKP